MARMAKTTGNTSPETQEERAETVASESELWLGDLSALPQDADIAWKVFRIRTRAERLADPDLPEREYAGSFTGPPDYDFVAERWGGGKWYLQGKRGSHFVPGAVGTLYIAGQPKPPQFGPSEKGSAVPSSEPSSPLVQQLLERMDRQDRLLAEVASVKVDPLASVRLAVELIKGLTPAAPAAQFSDMLALFTKGMEIGQSREPAEPDLLDQISRFAPLFGLMGGGPARVAPAPVQPQAVERLPEPPPALPPEPPRTDEPKKIALIPGMILRGIEVDLDPAEVAQACDNVADEEEHEFLMRVRPAAFAEQMVKLRPAVAAKAEHWINRFLGAYVELNKPEEDPGTILEQPAD